MAPSVGLDRAQVVAVAAQLADEGGLDQLTLAQVAARLGVKLPSLYNHIAGLPGLRRALALFGLDQLMDKMRRAGVGKAEDAAIMAVAQAYRAYATQRPGVYAATVRAPTANDLEWQQASQAVLEIVLAVLEPYDLDAVAAIHAVRGLRSIIHGFVSLELADGFGLVLDRDASFAWVLHGYIAGVRAVRTP